MSLVVMGSSQWEEIHVVVKHHRLRGKCKLYLCTARCYSVLRDCLWCSYRDLSALALEPVGYLSCPGQMSHLGDHPG